MDNEGLLGKKTPRTEGLLKTPQNARKVARRRVMRKNESVTAELNRRSHEHMLKLWRVRPDLTAEAAAEIVWRRVGRDIGMSRIEIARAQANYRDYLARKKRSKSIGGSI